MIAGGRESGRVGEFDSSFGIYTVLANLIGDRTTLQTKSFRN